MNGPTLRRRRAASGFTMLEALITAASISALIVLVVPGIARTRERAQSASCANNLQQIHRAIQSWKADQIHQSGGSDVLPADGWRAALAPYVGNTRVYDCPDTSSDSSPDAQVRAEHEIAQAPITLPDSAPPGSTCGPACLTCQSGLAVIAATQTTGRTPSDYALTGNLAKVDGKSHVVLGMDYLTETIVSTDDWTKAPFDAGAGNPSTFARHKGHFNVLYGDGSVRQVSTEGRDLSPSATSAEAKRFWRTD